ncbi:hypothetical protein [Luteibacter sp. UNCMF366Tsu5.1]|uniref:hypothetical protein n=1 Tax=Luteibacter sp. UNCMF366Tsu5.1 TaxID=1502758 RepID=UPI0009091A53|nr:hypothetical protein [Luteibacter sp. UNCMF366Tsu5.1]SFW52782.1 hypothetical protein SAMN02800691_1927 [Luteibacter sp. UNCMF366Tsu5.1]
MLKPWLPYLIGLAFATAANVGFASQVTVVASICDIVHSPEKYDDRRVSFRSHVESDGVHGAYLAEPECDKGITLESGGRADWTDLNRIMDTIGTVGTARKSVEASWVGVVHVKGPVISFSADGISDVTYKLSDGLRRRAK